MTVSGYVCENWQDYLTNQNALPSSQYSFVYITRTRAIYTTVAYCPARQLPLAVAGVPKCVTVTNRLCDWDDYLRARES